MNIFILDKIWCSQTQIPAIDLQNIVDDKSISYKLAWLRVGCGILLLFELLGYFLITLGLSENSSFYYFLIGMILKTVSGLSSSIIQNQSGVLCSLEIQKYLNPIKTFSQEVSLSLSNNGCSESEIQSLAHLPSEIYQSELNSYQRARLHNIGCSLACGCALIVSSEFFSALFIILLGIAAFPLGEYFFKSFTFRNDSKLRIAKSAQIISYIKDIYKEHIFQTFQINLLSQVPFFLFIFRFYWKTENLLSIFYGFTQGLTGLASSLAFQRSRVNSLRTTQTTARLIETLSSPEFIITSQRWEFHCLNSIKTSENITKIQDGVILKDFIPHRSKKFNNNYNPINCSIIAGSSCLIKAPSGSGKSTLFMALTHQLEHEGDLLFANKNKLVNAHDYSQGNFHKKIFFFREENTDKSFRLTDFFVPVLRKDLKNCETNMRENFGDMLTDLAWETSDNLLEAEIKQLSKNIKSLFPKAMQECLINFRTARNQKVMAYIKPEFEAEKIYPERSFHSLSNGEKRRFSLLLAYERARVDDNLQLILLDEPLAHLDESNVNHQIEMIKKIQALPTPPSLLIISHSHMEKLVQETKSELLQNIIGS